MEHDLNGQKAGMVAPKLESNPSGAIIEAGRRKLIDRLKLLGSCVVFNVHGEKYASSGTSGLVGSSLILCFTYCSTAAVSVLLIEHAGARRSAEKVGIRRQRVA